MDFISWPKLNESFYDIVDNEFEVSISWKGQRNKKYDEDFKILAENYINCAYIVAKEINKRHDNIKSDMWFLPCVYMFRQGIELQLKGLLCRVLKKGNLIQDVFNLYKHNLAGLFDKYIHIESEYLSKEEQIWEAKYLEALELVDANSDLFRYPFKDEFLQKYDSKFLNVQKMFNNMMQSCLILNKCFDYGKTSETSAKIINDKETKFLFFANHGIGNCYLWESTYSDGFYKQIEGYSQVAKFLLENENLANTDKVYPIIFLQRNLLELSLKRIISKDLKFGARKNKLNSHNFKELCESAKPVIKYYFESSEKQTPMLNLLEKQLLELSKIDKDGDIFRYPTTKSLEYKFSNKIIDIKHIYNYMQAIFNFLDANLSELEEILEWEKYSS